MPRPTRPRGFALVELAAAAVVLALLAAVLLALASESRRQSSLGVNFANLKQYAAGFAAYGADNDDRVATFSWRTLSGGGFGPPGTNYNQAASNQAVYIIRTRGNRPELQAISGWYAWSNFSHLVLLDYLDTHLPERFTAAPQDRLRLLWQQDPHGYFLLEPGVERPAGNSNADIRWPYSSSYELAPAFCSPDARQLDPSGGTIAQASTSTNYYVGTLPLGGRRLSEVAFPSQKAMVYEQYQRHFGPRMPYFSYPEARIPVLAADGAAAVRRTSDANLGYRPNDPLSAGTSRYSYSPSSWEPPTLSGLVSDLVTGHYRWTRSGLRGRDFGGPEIPWAE